MYVSSDVSCKDGTLTYFIGYVNSLLALWEASLLSIGFWHSPWFRLNNRKLMQDRSNLDSSRTNHDAKIGPTGISVNVQQTATLALGFAKSKHNSETEATPLELKGLVRVLHSVATRPGWNSLLIEGGYLHSLSARGAIKLHGIRSWTNRVYAMYGTTLVVSCTQNVSLYYWLSWMTSE